MTCNAVCQFAQQEDPLGRYLTYQYDAANQLVRSQSGATLTTYAYDNAGNRRLLQTISRTT